MFFSSSSSPSPTSSPPSSPPSSSSSHSRPPSVPSSLSHSGSSSSRLSSSSSSQSSSRSSSSPWKSLLLILPQPSQRSSPSSSQQSSPPSSRSSTPLSSWPSLSLSPDTFSLLCLRQYTLLSEMPSPASSHLSSVTWDHHSLPSSPSLLLESEVTAVRRRFFYIVVELSRGAYSYEIFKIDVADEMSAIRSDWIVGAHERRPDPKIRLLRGRYPMGMTFFALDTSIYMIGGSGGSVYVYDANTSQITRGPSMVSSLKSPLVIGSLAGRCYIISENLRESHFEVFDSQQQSWTSLACPPLPSAKEGHVTVISARAVIGPYIIICGLEFGMLLYDTGSDVWVQLNAILNPPKEVSDELKLDVFPFRGVAQYFEGRWFVLRPDLEDFPLFVYEVDFSPWLFGRGQRVSSIQSLQPASDSKKPIRFERMGEVVCMGFYQLGIVRSGSDGLQMGLYYPSRLTTVTQFHLVLKDDHLSAVNQKNASYRFSSPSDMATIRGCFSMVLMSVSFQPSPV